MSDKRTTQLKKLDEQITTGKWIRTLAVLGIVFVALIVFALTVKFLTWVPLHELR